MSVRPSCAALVSTAIAILCLAAGPGANDVAVAARTQAARPSPPQPFRSGVDMVRVDALVTWEGRPVTGLSAADFEIRDNGVPQRLSLVTRVGSITVLPVLDTSSSVVGDRLRELVAATRALIQSLRPGDSVGLMTFSQQVTLQVPVAPWHADSPALADVLNAVQARGRTAINDALFAGLTLAANDEGRSLLILFSDGQDSASWLTMRAVEDAARKSSTVVYVVAVGLDDPAPAAGDHKKFLRTIVDVTGGQLLQAESAGLREQFVRILDEFRQRYVLAYIPDGVRQDDGWHTIKVRLKSKAASVKARSGYFPANRKTSGAAPHSDRSATIGSMSDARRAGR